ncbi:MAG: NAD(P)/FAD-dependent oxidoreductase [Lachnospiraceae bacterium]
MSKVIVVGGGAAGMMAAIAAAECGHLVTLLEQNEKLGKKIYITGKGRCNLTNASDLENVFSNIVTNPKFLYSAIYGFDNQSSMNFFEENGLKIKIERGNRVFPASDHASDVIKTLEKCLRALHVEIRLNTRIKELMIEKEDHSADNHEECGRQKTGYGSVIKGIVDQHGKKYVADAVILATGGVSYETTGATGEGIRLSEKCGHHISQLCPALVPLETKEAWCRDLMGLSLKNVNVKIKNGKKVLFDEFGEMLFTHFGVSGPLILSASSKINTVLKKQDLQMFIDLKPALSEEQLQKRLIREFEENGQKQFKNALNGLFPARLIPVMISLSEINPEKKVCEISKAERQKFGGCIKALPLTIIGTRDFKEAIITRGGVSVKDINPSTMESKIVKGLYFAGEMIDVDALTGGYNLQIAWSTGHLAGSSVE